MLIVNPPPPPWPPEVELIETLALALVVTPSPTQLSENVVAAVSAPEDCEPDVANVPVQPLAAGVAEAVQLLALVEFQVRVTPWPDETLLALDVRVTVGATPAARSSPYEP